MQGRRYVALRDVIAYRARSLVRAPWSLVRGAFHSQPSTPNPQPSTEDFWALKDVSFEVKQGEVVGIIGRNGAGKSTLLKILSRITEPTEGRIRLRGRVASLLEVGTGFHPELTGRENIFLNGAILGMTREEIRRKFDEIVAFAEVEKFLDTPVKRYSSGMYVRLAFAVAAHLEPEILIIDEVLAVGDAQFQKKCLGKMGEVAKGGRTVLFVSHNMAAVMNLCPKALHFESGRLVNSGSTDDIVRSYLKHDSHNKPLEIASTRRVGTQEVQIEEFRIEPQNPATGDAVSFIFKLRTDKRQADVAAQVAVSITSETGTKLLQVFSKNIRDDILVSESSTEVVARVDKLPLAPGSYRLGLWVGSGHTAFDWIEDGPSLSIGPGCFREGIFAEYRGYPVILPSEWEARAAG